MEDQPVDRSRSIVGKWASDSNISKQGFFWPCFDLIQSTIFIKTIVGLPMGSDRYHDLTSSRENKNGPIVTIAI